MRKRMAVFAAAVWLAAAGLAGCGAAKERLAAREAAIALFENGDYEGAIAAIEELLADASRVGAFETDLLKYRGEAEYRAGDFRAAAYTYEILSQVDEEKPEYWYLASAALSEAGDPDGAEEKLADAKTADPDGTRAGYLEAVCALASAYEKAGNPESAKAVYEELTAAGKGTPAVYAAYAKLLIDHAEYEEALSAIGEGLNAGQASAASGEAAVRDLYFNQAVCQEYLGNYEEALALFRDYVSRYGDEEAAAHEIAFLQTR